MWRKKFRGNKGQAVQWETAIQRIEMAWVEGLPRSSADKLVGSGVGAMNGRLADQREGKLRKR